MGVPELDLSVLDTENRCQVCITAVPTWEVPTEENLRLLEQADKTSEQASTRLVVCDECLSLIEEYHVDPQRGLEALTARTLESMFTAGAVPGFGQLSTVTKKQVRLRAHMTVRRVQSETMRSIMGDPVRLTPSGD